MYPDKYKYTKDHEWIEFLDQTHVKIGITHYAQNELGDIVFVDLPKIDKQILAGAAFAVVESVKAASDVYSPLSIKITAVNEKLTTSPELVNSDPHNAGWFVESEIIDMSNIPELMNAEEYQQYLSSK